MMFSDVEQTAKERGVTDAPNKFIDDNGKLNKHAQVYFGLFKHLFDANSDNNTLADKGINNYKLVVYAFNIDRVVKKVGALDMVKPTGLC